MRWDCKYHVVVTPKKCRKNNFGYYKKNVGIYISLTLQTEEIKHRRGAEN